MILAGDLYSSPEGNKRGASGDVRDVWRAFAQVGRWVAGVAGNHDRFGNDREARRSRVVLHEGPHGDMRQRGNPRIRDMLAASEAALTICGHDHWDEPLASIDTKGQKSLQVLNVDARALLLTTAPG